MAKSYPVIPPNNAAALLLWFAQALAYSSGKRDGSPNHALLTEAVPEGSPLARVSEPISDDCGAYFEVALRRSRRDLNADPSLSEYRSSISVDPIGLAAWLLMLWLGGGSSAKRNTGRKGDHRRDYVDVFSGEDRVSLRRILFDTDEGRFAFEGEDRLDYRFRSARRLYEQGQPREFAASGPHPERGREHVLEVAKKLWERNSAKLGFALTYDDWIALIRLAFEMVDEERGDQSAPIARNPLSGPDHPLYAEQVANERGTRRAAPEAAE